MATPESGALAGPVIPSGLKHAPLAPQHREQGDLLGTSGHFCGFPPLDMHKAHPAHP